MRTEPLKVAFLSDEAHWLVSFQVRMAGAMGGKYLPRESSKNIIFSLNFVPSLQQSNSSLPNAIVEKTPS